MIEILAEGLRFPESPIWSQPDECLYLVEWYGNNVLVLRAGVLEILFQTEPGGGPSGLCQDPQGNLWACLYDCRKVVCYSSAGKPLRLIEEFHGLPFRGPCDIDCSLSGDIYFTDSGDYDQDWRSGRPAGSIYHFNPHGELHQIDRNICFPNGIAVSREGKFLYINEHRRNRTLVYGLDGKGSFITREILHEFPSEPLLPEESAFQLGPDGMCVGEHGSLWVAHYGGGKVFHLDPSGSILDFIRLPRGRMPTSVAYCQAESALYITEAEFGLLYKVSLTH